MNSRNNFRLSRFVHFVSVDGSGYTALWNTLNLEVVFIRDEAAEQLKKNSSLFPESFIEELKKREILVGTDRNELADYQQIQNQLPGLPIKILYLLLTESCNFACGYCFIEGGMPTDHPLATMKPETAKAGIDLFARVIAKQPDDRGRFQVVFYGGEPLLNFKTIVFALEYIQKLQQEEKLPVNLGLVLNSNASCVTKRIAEVLARYNVTAAVSIDGPKEIHDQERVFRSGKGTFDSTMRGYLLLKQAGVRLSISCTISQAGVGHLPETLDWFIKELGVESLGFNLLRESEVNQIDDPDYAVKAAQALVVCFEIAREKGVYEDRTMRKVKAFLQKQPYLNDCAGCGQQLVVAPTGEIGVCHGPVGKRLWFVDNSPTLDPVTHPHWQEWRRRSPFSMPECLDCIALGICGGGCPYEAYLEKGSIWARDEIFCVHAREMLNFLIQDLFAKTISTGV